MDDDFDYITTQNYRYRDFWKVRNIFFESLCAAEQHWFFVQGHDAYVQQLYLPALSSLLNGIEATLRVTLHQIDAEISNKTAELSPYRVLSNNLILQASEKGMEVRYLAFNDEQDFMEKLHSSKPNRRDVEIVRLRNNICHGNVFEFINRDLGAENSFFSPEALKLVTEKVLAISADWCESLGSFRRSHGLLHYNKPSDPQREKDFALYDAVIRAAKTKP
ncbi:hypothetical protein [Tabrizicola sp.]|uniref:hypothetical protein n=1 Tax=Tabrizicola sp. TaxID=2005166 RepID=UPI002736886F|nr:hypothetical protein [Tabrizicola sp.]MDP3195315.1 hypothetical protein [Tabrizicola sp.]